jgi:hypothetical protein
VDCFTYTSENLSLPSGKVIKQQLDASIHSSRSHGITELCIQIGQQTKPSQYYVISEEWK